MAGRREGSLTRTDKVLREVNDIILKTPGIEHTSANAGFDVTTSTVAPNSATIFLGLPSLYGKHIPGVNAASMLTEVRKRLARHFVCVAAVRCKLFPPHRQAHHQPGHPKHG